MINNNPYAPSAVSQRTSRIYLRFRYVYLVFLVFWPALSITTQIIDGVGYSVFGLVGLNVFEATARNIPLQLSFLALGPTACIIAAVRERINGGAISICGMATLTFIGVIVVLVEIVVFHPPSS